MRVHALSRGGSPSSEVTDSDERAVKAPEVTYKFDSCTGVSWTPGVLYVPSGSTFESGDALLIEGSGEEGELHTPQLTVAGTHPTKAKGLLRTVKYFKDSGYKVDSSWMRTYLVPVTQAEEGVSAEGLTTNCQTTGEVRVVEVRHRLLHQKSRIVVLLMCLKTKPSGLVTTCREQEAGASTREGTSRRFGR